MWENVIIGNGDKGHTAIRVFNIKGEHSISENNVSYWIDDLLFNMGMTIFKDTTEGKKLTELILKKNQNLSEILNFLNTILLKNINIKDVEIALINIKNQAFENGKDSLRYELKKILNI
jgi:hypothetical protein